jgi:hypothetical protein
LRQMAGSDQVTLRLHNRTNVRHRQPDHLCGDGR